MQELRFSSTNQALQYLSNLHGSKVIIGQDMLTVDDSDEEFFEKRTREHINRVRDNLAIIGKYTDFDARELEHRGQIHDASKFESPERGPYVWLTKKKKLKEFDGIDLEYPEDVMKEVNQATNHHILHNLHHPEAHSDEETPIQENDDRDAPAKTIDASRMNDIDIVEMVCDWTAMAQELNQCNGSARCWADDNVNKRWTFTEPQVELIYDTIKVLEDHVS